MSIRERFGRYLDGYELDDDMGVDSEPASAYVRSTMLEAIQELDPRASLQGFANIRLIGDRFSEGMFDAHAAEIFGQLDLELRAAAPPDQAQDMLIGFRSVQQGSVVLPLAPFAGVASTPDQLPGTVPSALENALLRVVEMHRAVESDSDPRALGDIPRELVKRLRLLVEALDKHDAALEIDVSRTNGRRTQSRLTHRGRANARRMFEPRLSIEVDQVSGLLESVAIRGELAQIELREGRKKVPIVRVPAHIAKTALQWDVLLRVEFRSEVRTDGFGQQERTERQFIRIVGHEEPFELDPASS